MRERKDRRRGARRLSWYEWHYYGIGVRHALVTHSHTHTRTPSPRALDSVAEAMASRLLSDRITLYHRERERERVERNRTLVEDDSLTPLLVIFTLEYTQATHTHTHIQENTKLYTRTYRVHVCMVHARYNTIYCITPDRCPLRSSSVAAGD